jgi:hypothetical protein
MYRLVLAATLICASSGAIAQQQSLPVGPWMHNCVAMMEAPLPPELQDYVKEHPQPTAPDNWHYCVQQWNMFHPDQKIPDHRT